PATPGRWGFSIDPEGEAWENSSVKRSLLSLLFAVSAFNAMHAADVIDDSLRLRFNFDAAPVNDVIVDTSPSATHPGSVFGAVWNSNEMGRNGVTDFKAPIPN